MKIRQTLYLDFLRCHAFSSAMQTHKNPNLSLVAPTIGVDSIRLPEAGLYGNAAFPDAGSKQYGWRKFSVKMAQAGKALR